ncbi:MAG TPA: carbonate dehydratase [Lentisphaeria bacterium]|nr:MAG: carbonic anhydrase [Lentisphaerae bacterium GWF2_50_93]HCE43347.1 carbonate dehydratase [Lentisphaeria bacterium]
MKTIKKLFDNNRLWADSMTRMNKDFFKDLARQQSPKYLWIGCADSRVPANEIVGLLPGEIFVHRNVANLVIHTDINCLSVLQFAVEILKVEHVIVCGHYGCGGIKAAVEDQRHGLIDNWLRHVRDVYHRHELELKKEKDKDSLLRRLCELNIREQVLNIANTTTVQDAWRRGQGIAVHGWVYDIHDGLLRDLKVSISRKNRFAEKSLFIT